MKHRCAAYVFGVLAGSLPFLAGCQSSGPERVPTEPERVRMLSLMMPAAIEIQPFSKIRSFDEDEVPDGLLVVVRVTDRLGEPVKAAGLFYFELWTYLPASGEPKGERLAFWDRSIASVDEIRQYWTRAQMYEFRLAWTAGLNAIAPNRKYVLKATYRPPWDEIIQDEYVIDFQLPAETLFKADSTR